MENFLNEIVPTKIYNTTEVLDILRLQFQENSPILHMLNSNRLQVHNILMRKDCKKQLIEIIPKPLCDLNFFYHTKQDNIIDTLVALEVSEKVFLSSVTADKTCFVGKWRLHIHNTKDSQNSSLIYSKVGPPWHFDQLVPLVAGNHYVLKLYGHGTRSKHREPVPFNSTLNGISFCGAAASCKIKLEYWTSLDHFDP